jgi:hypothetical protein
VPAIVIDMARSMEDMALCMGLRRSILCRE